MALTDDDIKKIEKLFDQLDYYDKQRVLSSQASFEQWLYKVSYSIYVKVKNWLNDLWNWLFA